MNDYSLKIRQIILLLSLASPVISAQNIYLSSGVTFNSTTIKIINSQNGNLDDYKAHKFAIDYLNILTEIEISDKSSFKTGIYFHPEYFEYNTSERDSYGGTTHYYYNANKILKRNLDFPFLDIDHLIV